MTKHQSVHRQTAPKKAKEKIIDFSELIVSDFFHLDFLPLVISN